MKRIQFVALLALTHLTGLAQQEKCMMAFLNIKSDKAVLSQQQKDSLQEGHMANISRLAKENKLLVAGYFEGGGGIFIFNTSSPVEAREWLASDPAISANRYNIELLPWTARVGAICAVGSAVEMIAYTFVRYHSHITKYNVQEAPLWFNRHDEYIKPIIATGNVISEGVFDNSDGATILMKGEVGKAVIDNDPAVKYGLLLPEIKTLYVGKGSFCEK